MVASLVTPSTVMRTVRDAAPAADDDGALPSCSPRGGVLIARRTQAQAVDAAWAVGRTPSAQDLYDLVP